jgi:hypothetical protein
LHHAIVRHFRQLQNAPAATVQVAALGNRSAAGYLIE